MKIGKQALLDAIYDALLRHENDTEAWQRAVAEWQKRQAKKWVTEELPKWRQLRDMITASVKTSKPITIDMVAGVLQNKRGYGSTYISDHTYSPDASPTSPIVLDGTKVHRPNPAPIHDLKALQLFLLGAEDESFSMEALSRLGFKAPAFVFRAAVTEE